MKKIEREERLSLSVLLNTSFKLLLLTPTPSSLALWPLRQSMRCIEETFPLNSQQTNGAYF
jgi:hypothetical protein